MADVLLLIISVATISTLAIVKKDTYVNKLNY